MVARTLTQHAVPTTFGLKVAGWLTGILDAYDDLGAVRLPGPARRRRRHPRRPRRARGHRRPRGPAWARRPAEPRPRASHRPGTPPRTPVTRLGDAAVRCTDAWGRIANDVLALARPEVGELAEGSGGGSSTMPHKANPVLSTLLRRAALAAPPLGRDPAPRRGRAGRRAGGRRLARRVGDARHCCSDGPWSPAPRPPTSLTGLRVHTDRMRATLDAAGADVLAEQRSMAALAGRPPRDGYRGARHRARRRGRAPGPTPS